MCPFRAPSSIRYRRLPSPRKSLRGTAEGRDDDLRRGGPSPFPGRVRPGYAPPMRHKIPLRPAALAAAIALSRPPPPRRRREARLQRHVDVRPEAQRRPAREDRASVGRPRPRATSRRTRRASGSGPGSWASPTSPTRGILTIEQTPTEFRSGIGDDVRVLLLRPREQAPGRGRLASARPPCGSRASGSSSTRRPRRAAASSARSTRSSPAAGLMVDWRLEHKSLKQPLVLKLVFQKQ